MSKKKIDRKKKIDTKVFTKMTASLLFKTTKDYHHRKLKNMFHQYYCPDQGPNWIISLSEDTIRDLRLHLSWELGMNVFDHHIFPKYILGKMIIDRFEDIGILSYIVKAITNNMR